MTRRLVGRYLTGPTVAAALLAASPAAAGASPPTIQAGGIHLTGGLPDGSVAPGASVDLRIDPGAITADPAPAIAITWREIHHGAGSDVTAESDTAYGEPLTAPAPRVGEEIQITATVKVTNADGVAAAAAPVLTVRLAPYMTNYCCGVTPVVPPALHVRAGQRIRVGQLELGDQLGLPEVVAGTPTPRVTMRWMRCRHHRCASIPKATGSSYAAKQRDLGYTLRLRLTARNPLGSYSVDLLTPGGRAVS